MARRRTHHPEILLSPTQLAQKWIDKQIKEFESQIVKLRTHVTLLENKNAELRERLTNKGDREQFERQIRDLKRELDRRDKIIAELRSR